MDMCVVDSRLVYRTHTKIDFPQINVRFMIPPALSNLVIFAPEILRRHPWREPALLPIHNG